VNLERIGNECVGQVWSYSKGLQRLIPSTAAGHATTVHKWRGGKRVFAGNNGDNSKKKKKKESNKKAKVVPSGNGLKENGDQMEAPGVHQHHSLANDKADNNIVFEYPMPSAPAAAAPLYHPMMPAISTTAGYLPLPSPITKAAAEVFMNSVEI